MRRDSYGPACSDSGWVGWKAELGSGAVVAAASFLVEVTLESEKADKDHLGKHNISRSAIFTASTLVGDP